MDLILKSLINGFGKMILPFWKDMIPFAGSIFILLIIFEILREAIDISIGKGFNLGVKLIVIFFVGTTLLGYGKLSTGIYNAAVDIGDTVIKEFGSVNKKIEESYFKGSERHEAALEKSGDEAGFFEGFFIGMVMAILSGICLMIMFFIMILILVFIAGAYASLAIVLAIGPVFVAMFVSSEFRSIGTKWSLITLSYLLVIPIYIMVMNVMIELFGQNAYKGNILSSSNISVSASVEQMILLMAGPLISLGLVFSVSKIVDQLIGTAGNAGQTFLAAGASAILISKTALRGGMNSLKSIGGKMSTGSKSGGKDKNQGRIGSEMPGGNIKGINRNLQIRKDKSDYPMGGSGSSLKHKTIVGVSVKPNPPRISADVASRKKSKNKKSYLNTPKTVKNGKQRTSGR